MDHNGYTPLRAQDVAQIQCLTRPADFEVGPWANGAPSRTTLRRQAASVTVNTVNRFRFREANYGKVRVRPSWPRPATRSFASQPGGVGAKCDCRHSQPFPNQ